ncbi:hypothetical protein [Ornithinibacillus bavariensis]|uniref:hypothetical protein n=1 Tax=Ornithinibacillus bavariensis TaxID=545502 RepID=UPI000EEAD53A|nr:hypothetical protein [Ornithinibacillus sp.]
MEGMLSITEEEIKRYYELNKLQKEVKQEMDHLKKKFHDILDASYGKEKKGEVQRGNYKLQRQIRVSTSYDDAIAVKKLDEMNLKDFIIVTRTTDKEKLESAFKLGLVEEDEFKDCKVTKLIPSITVKETFSSAP